VCIEEDTTKGERTRRRLLDVAASEVARRGLAGASLSAIAREVGIKPGSIYFHFGSKEALIEAMLEDGIRASLHRLAAALDDTPAPGGAEGRLRAAVRAHLGALADLRDYAVVVLAPQFAEDREALPTFRALRHDYLEHWRRIVADAQRATVLPDGLDPREIRDLLLGALNAAGLSGRSPDRTAMVLAALLGFRS